jgi:hypothetical protein
MSDHLPPEVTSAAVEEAKGLLNKFLGSAFKEAGAMLGNNVRMFRLRQEIKLLRKAEQILKDSGLEPKAVNRGGSLNLSPAPSAKAIPPGAISPELELKILMEAHSIVFKIGCEKPGVALFGRTLRVHLGKMESCKNEMEFLEATFPLREFCAERDLKLETHRVL